MHVVTNTGLFVCHWAVKRKFCTKAVSRVSGSLCFPCPSACTVLAPVLSPMPVNACLNQHTNPESFEKYKFERELELSRESQTKKTSG